MSELGWAISAHQLWQAGWTASCGWCTAGPLLFYLYSPLCWESSGWHWVFKHLLQDLIHTENSYLFILSLFIAFCLVSPLIQGIHKAMKGGLASGCVLWLLIASVLFLCPFPMSIWWISVPRSRAGVGIGWMVALIQIIQRKQPERLAARRECIAKVGINPSPITGKMFAEVREESLAEILHGSNWLFKGLGENLTAKPDYYFFSPVMPTFLPFFWFTTIAIVLLNHYMYHGGTWWDMEGVQHCLENSVVWRKRQRCTWRMSFVRSIRNISQLMWFSSWWQVFLFLSAFFFVNES